MESSSDFPPPTEGKPHCSEAQTKLKAMPQDDTSTCTVIMESLHPKDRLNNIPVTFGKILEVVTSLELQNVAKQGKTSLRIDFDLFSLANENIR